MVILQNYPMKKEKVVKRVREGEFFFFFGLDLETKSAQGNDKEVLWTNTFSKHWSSHLDNDG